MFIITERQYNIIMQQAQACYPQESGGILGGTDNKIMAVLPIANKNIYDRTKEFALWKEDIERGYAFLEKYNMQYLGIYHTHPQGVPYPSDQDLSHGQKYLFIIGLRDRYNPELRAWRCEGKKVYQEDIKIISDQGITVIDVKTGKPKLSQNTKMINVYSNADSYLDLANVFLNLGLGRKTIENGENIQLDGLKHSLFNYNRQISYDGWVMKLFDLYVNLIKS